MKEKIENSFPKPRLRARRVSGWQIRQALDGAIAQCAHSGELHFVVAHGGEVRGKKWYSETEYLVVAAFRGACGCVRVWYAVGRCDANETSIYTRVCREAFGERFRPVYDARFTPEKRRELEAQLLAALRAGELGETFPAI